MKSESTRVLARYVKDRNLETKGFVEALRAHAREVAEFEVSQSGPECEKICERCSEEYKECRKYSVDELEEFYFDEYFGGISCRPAAFKVIEGNRSAVGSDGESTEKKRWPELHVYECENTALVSDEKLKQYGEIADRDSDFLVFCHIIDRFGQERVIDHDHLMSFSFLGLFDDKTAVYELGFETTENPVESVKRELSGAIAGIEKHIEKNPNSPELLLTKLHLEGLREKA